MSSDNPKPTKSTRTSHRPHRAKQFSSILICALVPGFPSPLWKECSSKSKVTGKLGRQINIG
jgi:hypothetical protein